MSALFLPLDCLGGTHIEAACLEACAIANRLSIDVHFPFNGVTVIASPGDSPFALEKAYQLAMAQGREVASVWRAHFLPSPEPAA